MIDREKAQSEEMRAALKQIDVRLDLIEAVVNWWSWLLKLPLEDPKAPLPDADAVDRVMANLRELLRELIESDELLHLGVDYEPYGALADANVLAGCPSIPWPGKTRMTICFKEGWAEAKPCRSCDFEMVYGEKQGGAGDG